MEETKGPVDITDNDIIFECPICTKSLAIDKRGAGYTIVCPDCSHTVQVPVPDHMSNNFEKSTPQDMARALAESNERIKSLSLTLHEVYERRKYLEKLRTMNLDQFDKVRKELRVIQGAMDRLNEVMQDVEPKSE